MVQWPMEMDHCCVSSWVGVCLYIFEWRGGHVLFMRHPLKWFLFLLYCLLNFYRTYYVYCTLGYCNIQIDLNYLKMFSIYFFLIFQFKTCAVVGAKKLFQSTDGFQRGSRYRKQFITGANGRQLIQEIQYGNNWANPFRITYQNIRGAPRILGAWFEK